MKKLFALLILLGALSSCSNGIDKTMFNKDKEPGKFDETRFDESKFN